LENQLNPQILSKPGLPLVLS